MSNPFRYFNSSPQVIRLVVMMYVRYPLSLRNVEDLLAERGIDISHETIRCHSAWGPNADRRGNFLNCLREEGQTQKPIHSGIAIIRLRRGEPAAVALAPVSLSTP
jgi:hypothetical protein